VALQAVYVTSIEAVAHFCKKPNIVELRAGAILCFKIYGQGFFFAHLFRV
jgi:hypothetical protein